MTQKEFFHEVVGWKNQRIFNKIKKLKLPVIIFGTGVYAVEVTRRLNEHDIEVFGYAVDSDYYVPNKIYLNRPVYDFEKLALEGDKYVFVLGIGALVHPGYMNTEKARKLVNRKIKFMNDKRITKYEFIWEKGTNITYEYVLENKDKLWETYSYLSDDVSKKLMLAYLKSYVTDDLSCMAHALESIGEYSKDPVSAISDKASFPVAYFNELTLDAMSPWGGDM